MLIAVFVLCAGDGNSAVAVAAMRLLLAAGAVPDTWAPNGSSALMLAASANGVAALQVRFVKGSIACCRFALCFGQCIAVVAVVPARALHCSLQQVMVLFHCAHPYHLATNT